MKGVRVDPEARTARVQAGVLLGELDRETQAFGLAVPSGIVTHTGVAGLTLGGGIGWIMRKHGLSVDQLRLGRPRHRRRRVREGERGRERRPLLGRPRRRRQLRDRHRVRVPLRAARPTRSWPGPVFWPMEQSGEVLRFYRDWVADAPDELMTIVVHRKAPPLPFVPEELRRQAGGDGRRLLGRRHRGGGAVRPSAQAVRPPGRGRVHAEAVPRPPGDVRSQLPPGRWYYFKSCDVPGLTDEIIDITVERSLQIKSPLTSFPIWQMGGAVAGG